MYPARCLISPSWDPEFSAIFTGPSISSSVGLSFDFYSRESDFWLHQVRAQTHSSKGPPEGFLKTRQITKFHSASVQRMRYLCLKFKIMIKFINHFDLAILSIPVHWAKPLQWNLLKTMIRWRFETISQRLSLIYPLCEAAGSCGLFLITVWSQLSYSATTTAHPGWNY